MATQGMMYRAAERAVETILNAAASVTLELPPANALSEQQQADIYLSILSTPVMIEFFKNAYGEQGWKDYRADMDRKLARLGAINVNLSPGITQDELDAIHLVSAQFAEQREERDESGYTGP